MKKIMCLLICFFLVSPAFAETEIEENLYVPHQWWLNIGLGGGFGFYDNFSNFASGGGAQISINGMISPKLFLTLESTGLNSTNRDSYDTSFLLGYKCKNPHSYWSIAAGIGYQKVERYHRYRYNYKDSFGVPVEFQLFWLPFRHFGVGLIEHTFISQNPYTMVLLSIQFS